MAVLGRLRRKGVRAELAELRERVALAEARAVPDPDTPPGASVQRRGYEYGAALLASSPSAQLAQSAERLQILNQLHQAYLTCPWVSAPIDLVARTVTAGGLQVVWQPADKRKLSQKVPADPPEVQRLKRLIRFVNPREDMVQLLRQSVIDLKLFGDCYLEVVTLASEPVALYTLDATTMTVLTDPHGEVLGYKQQTDAGLLADFAPDEVIHISLDAPRGGVYGVSPAQKALLPITAWLFTEATIKENFRRGDPPRVHVDLAHLGDTEVQTWREQYMVYNLGPKAVGNPLITTNGGVVTILDPRKVTDYLSTTRQLRDEILSTIGIPPAKIGVIEAGNLGGGTGETQDKAVDLSTMIPTPAGWTTMGSINVGDLVLDEAGRPCKVTGAYEVPNADSWRLHFSDGTYIDCCSDHLWTTWTEKDRKAYGRCLTTDSHAVPVNWPEWRSGRGYGPKVRRTEEIISTLEARRYANGVTLMNHSIPLTGALQLPKKNLPIPPYTLGAWLGDETSVLGNITCHDQDIAMIPEIRSDGFEVHEIPSARRSGTSAYHVRKLRSMLRQAGILGAKTVPEVYLRASAEQRLALLQGLMDSDGGFSSGQQVLFRNTNEGLADAVIELARSLGQKPVKAKGRSKLNGIDYGVQYAVTFTPTIQMFRLPRKANKWTRPNSGMRLLSRTIIAAEKIPDRPMRCIRVDSPNAMYLAGEGMIPTHNTFRVNTIIPVQALVLEKLNYHLLQRGFGITDWRLQFGEIDYRDSQIVENIRDMRLRNGSYNLNRYRDEIGEPPVPGGDEPVLVDRQNLVLWRDMDAMSKAGIAMKLKGTALEPSEPQIGQPMDVEKPQPSQPAGFDPDTGPDTSLPSDDRPGGPDDAVQGVPPREHHSRHAGLLGPAAAAEYQRRLAEALRARDTS